MAEWNPNTTDVKGPEFFAYQAGSITLDSLTKSAAQSIVQTASQDIGTIRVYCSAAATRGGLYFLEVFDDEDPTSDFITDATTYTARPNQDVTAGGTGNGEWREDDDDTTNMYQEIDESTLNKNDFIYVRGALTSDTWYHRYNTASLGISGDRILGVAYVVSARKASGSGSVSLEVVLNIGGTDYSIGTKSLTTTSTTYTFSLPYNPATLRPWTITDLTTFDSTDEVGFIGHHANTSISIRVEQAYMSIVTIPENRIAVGALDDTASGLTIPGWNIATMLDPDGSTTWTKDGADRHFYLLRRVSTTGALSVPTLVGTASPNPATGYDTVVEGIYGTVDDGVLGAFYGATLGAANTRTWPLIQRTTAPAESVDSIPYAVPVAAVVDSGQDAEQEFSDAAATDYAGLRFLCYPSASGIDDLVVVVKRRSDNVQLGGDLTLPAADVLAMDPVVAGGSFRLIEDRLDAAATLATSTQYYVEFSSTEATGSWTVQSYDTADQGNGATFGGTTDRALVNTSEADRYDIPVTISTSPSAPADFAGSVATDTLDATPTYCDVASVDYVALSWTATSLSGDFDYYEIQRSLDGGSTWETIALLGDESDEDFDDYETPRGTAASYRLRVARADGAFSDWTSAGAFTASALDCEIIFTTNQDPSLTVAFNRDPRITYEFLDAEEVTFLPLYERDYQAAFQPSEARGTRFVVPLTVSAVETPASEGVPVFDELRAIATADVAYVCVLDHYGNRFLASVQVPEGTHSEPGKLYVAAVSVTEITATSAAVVTT